MDNQFDSIMDRIRARQSEMTGSEAKENDAAVLTRKTSIKEEQTPTKVFGLSTRSNDSGAPPVQFRQPDKTQTTPDGTYQDSQFTENSSVIDKSINQSSTTTKKTSRFSMLAAEIENFEYDYESPYNKPKEAYMKGRSPRMSIGETRPAILCTPAGHAASKSPNVAKPSQSAPEVVKSNGPEIALGRSDFEARRIKFAQPIVNVNYLPNESSIFSGSGSSVNDQSTVLGGSAEMMNVTTSSLSCGELSMNQHITHENTIINAQSCDNREAILQGRLAEPADEYGAHTFMRKKVAKDPAAVTSSTTSTTSTASGAFSTTTSSGALGASKSDPQAPTSIFTRPTNVHQLVSSPKPYSKDIGRSMFSPVHFTPKSTSSPKTLQHPTAVPNTDTVLSPSKSAALQMSVAKTRRMEFEEKLRGASTNANVPTLTTAAPIPTPRHAGPPPSSAPPTIHNTPHFQIPPQQKKNLFGVPLKSVLNPAPAPLVATAPLPVQTQWRGQANTPVVQGARADEKTAGTQLIGAGVGKLKNLKSRWEFSSATGTPIHPDATEDSLIETAKKMKESAIPNRIGHRSISSRKGPSTTSIHSQNAATPYEPYEEELEDEEDEVFDDIQNPEDVKDVADTSRFIDNAFGFMEGPGTETPSPYRDPSHDNSLTSPLKTLRENAEVIEEEDVQEEEYTEPEEEEDDDDVTEIQNQDQKTLTEEAEETPVYRANNSQLVHSVSMYRRKQREKNSAPAQPLSSISPSAPMASLTSPQKLKSLTKDAPGGGRIFETQHDAIQRLQTAIVIEKKLVQQSEHALARARHEPTFRGSREEFEAQRAYLVHMEKLRAMQNELQRVQVEGARIIDGPRGTITINALTVSIDTAYVAAHIASKKSEEVFYFLAVLRYADQVDVSKLVTSDSGLNRTASLDFPVPLRLVKIPADFRATVEIYGQRSIRESTTHEDKFKLKGTTLKAKTRNPFSGNSSSSGNQSIFGSLNQTVTGIGSSSGGPITDFHLLGSFSFDINCPGKHVYQLSHVVHPIAGRVQMKVKKTPDDGADILFRGFLSMYQRTNEGLGSWTRYWCVLENGEMKFWRQPEDEGSKGYLVLMDLSTCCRSEGASTVQDICPFPNSFHIDVWVPKDEPEDASRNASVNGPPGIMPLRVMLAADTSVDLQKWLSVINSTSKQLCTWRNPIVPQ